LGISALGSVHHNRLVEVNRALQTQGYSTVGSNQPVYGLGFDGGWKRWRVAVDAGLYGARTYRLLAGGEPLSVYQASVSLDAGFDFVQLGGLSIFTMMGAAVGDLRMQIDPSQPPILREQIVLFPNEREVRRNTWSMRGLIGIEQRVVLWDRVDDQLLLVMGLRLGWAEQVSQGRWMFAEPTTGELVGGPQVDSSGAFMRWGIGLIGTSK
jgi:hypothetical protein